MPDKPDAPHHLVRLGPEALAEHAHAGGEPIPVVEEEPGKDPTGERARVLYQDTADYLDWLQKADKSDGPVKIKQARPTTRVASSCALRAEQATPRCISWLSW